MNAFVFIFEKKRKLRGPETVRKTHSNTISRSTSRSRSSSSSSRSRITNRQPIAQPIAMQVLAIAQSRVNASIHKFVICFYGRLPHKVPKKTGTFGARMLVDLVQRCGFATACDKTHWHRRAQESIQ